MKFLTCLIAGFTLAFFGLDFALGQSAKRPSKPKPCYSCNVTPYYAPKPVYPRPYQVPMQQPYIRDNCSPSKSTIMSGVLPPAYKPYQQMQDYQTQMYQQQIQYLQEVQQVQMQYMQMQMQQMMLLQMQVQVQTTYPSAYPPKDVLTFASPLSKTGYEMKTTVPGDFRIESSIYSDPLKKD